MGLKITIATSKKKLKKLVLFNFVCFFCRVVFEFISSFLFASPYELLLFFFLNLNWTDLGIIHSPKTIAKITFRHFFALSLSRAWWRNKLQCKFMETEFFRNSMWNKTNKKKNNKDKKNTKTKTYIEATTIATTKTKNYIDADIFDENILLNCKLNEFKLLKFGQKFQMNNSNVCYYKKWKRLEMNCQTNEFYLEY